MGEKCPYCGNSCCYDGCEEAFLSEETLETEDQLYERQEFNQKIDVLESLILMGYGALIGTFKRDHIIIDVYEPLALEEKDSIMAKNLCLLNLGIFSGVFDVLGIDIDGKEVECVLTGDKKCSFKIDLIGQEIEDKLIDEDMSEEAVSSFLASL